MNPLPVSVPAFVAPSPLPLTARLTAARLSPAAVRRTGANVLPTCRRRVPACHATPPPPSSAHGLSSNRDDNDDDTANNSNNNAKPDAKASNDGAFTECDNAEYRQSELLDDDEAAAAMKVWNDVIHASLKRKLQGLVAEKPVTNGVSALLQTSPAVTSSSSSSSSSSTTSQSSSPTSLSSPTSSSATSPSSSTFRPPSSVDVDAAGGVTSAAGGEHTSGLSPGQVVSHLLSSFKQDALTGATTFVKVASQDCHVKHTNAETLVLFIGDNDSYRPLLRISSFYVAAPRFEAGGMKCVISVETHQLEVSVSGGESGNSEDCAKFDFQLSCDASGAWLIDEVFRI